MDVFGAAAPTQVFVFKQLAAEEKTSDAFEGKFPPAFIKMSLRK